ncbi:hypothetical protein OCK74_07620 [Chitinophagaceae bacterium LB-8]|uniref:Polymerase nucleotidyl transferase domain-containing protein n=1 Tax=Paraflavisolibacter caeni TaxID=2982496 RepID=A0A9X2XUP9_9BACT|nr:hypothetical protein [Paraflavisolibacter caeni]MCU7548980.1 hypothetical protein [Paraflavisolibacter caeni]
MFDYPLTEEEIFLFLPNKYPITSVKTSIEALELKNCIYQFDEFYSIQNKANLSRRRKAGNDKAKKLLKTAHKIAHFLSYFPFVRGIGISGSLSKNFADDQSDIDLFIITASNRLWLARTMMHCFKKLTFLLHKQHFFCMNYYIDEEMLQIREKNIYTAIEVVTLLPLYGITVFANFYKSNTWSSVYLPNQFISTTCIQETPLPLFKRTIEFMFNHVVGNYLDNLFMKITTRRWHKKTQQRKLNNRGIVMSMDAGKKYAKPNPMVFQTQLLEIYKKRLLSIMNKYENYLEPIN